ncbi:MAG TPA: YHS domain-containing protein [Candidatus Heimdallarchaeota archaeon]|nr:YHS domain-containing protein [Candidatus Heimdallarchaeota archaeon]
MSKHSRFFALFLAFSLVFVLTGISQEESDETVICPVSGKEIKKSEAKSTYEYEGMTYYFCCDMCKEKFIKDPEKYTQKRDEMKEIYTCPMHPEVKSDKPSECPKCGMKLEKKMMPMKHMHGEEQEHEQMMEMKTEGKACCGMMGMMNSNDVEMKVEELDDGVAVKITSKNAETVKKIKEYASKMKAMCCNKQTSLKK